jgi:putative phage-type endonuclease
MEAYKEQRSPEWIRFREGKLGGSSAGSVLGINPYCSPLDLYNQMKGIAPPVKENAAMRRGSALENNAIEWLMMARGESFSPDVLTFSDNERIIASLDGINFKRDTIIEIKCSDRIYEEAKKGKIPPYYRAQMQHCMMVAQCDLCLYVAYDGFEGVIIEVNRDQEFIDKLYAAELQFLEYLDNDTPPPSNARQYLPIEVNEYKNKIISDWIMVNNQLKHVIELEKTIRASLCDLTDDGDCELVYNGKPRLRLKRISRDGSTDWAKLCQDRQISMSDVEKYKKKSIGYWKLEAL